MDGSPRGWEPSGSTELREGEGYQELWMVRRPPEAGCLKLNLYLLEPGGWRQGWGAGGRDGGLGAGIGGWRHGWGARGRDGAQ